MGKNKSSTGGRNKHLHARIAFLERAATQLTTQTPPSPAIEDEATASDFKEMATVTSQPNPSARLANHLVQISKKSQIRLTSSMKHQICKRCSSILLDGTTSRKFVENLSKRSAFSPNGKRHADVLVVECGVCGARKRWPVGLKRQKKKGIRQSGEFKQDADAEDNEPRKTGNGAEESSVEDP